MKRLMGSAALVLTIGVADAQPGWDTYDAVSSVVCTGRPVLLQGSHTDVQVTGPCRTVRISGEHNDIRVDIAPGGLIEIIGEHNDVWWRQIGRGQPPRLIARVPHNTFHPQRD